MLSQHFFGRPFFGSSFLPFLKPEAENFVIPSRASDEERAAMETQASL